MSPHNCVLLVDDSSAVRSSLHEVFEHAGWKVCGEADNGRDAIEKARKLQPKLIVLDLSMPEMDGLSAGKVLRQILPEAHVILFTCMEAWCRLTNCNYQGFLLWCRKQLRETICWKPQRAYFIGVRRN